MALVSIMVAGLCFGERPPVLKEATAERGCCPS
jgi:hypothetical protein